MEFCRLSDFFCSLTYPGRCRLKKIGRIADESSVEATARQRINFAGFIHGSRGVQIFENVEFEFEFSNIRRIRILEIGLKFVEWNSNSNFTSRKEFDSNSNSLPK
jgi:hypothetical protein